MSDQPRQRHTSNNSRHSPELQERMERVFRDLVAFVQTPESDALLERMDQLKALKREEPVPQGPVLTPLEEKALRFIKRQQAKGRFPTVREVAKAVGRKSSRTGLRILRGLASKGVIVKTRP